MRLRFIAAMSVLFAAFLCPGQAGVLAVGGNILPLRPAYTASDLTTADTECKALGKGATPLRMQIIFWEVYWGPNPATGNYRGIDADIELAAKYNQSILFLLAPCPYPSSLWYRTVPNSDWWNPPAWTYPDLANCIDALVKHIETKAKASRVSISYQLLNELGGSKPGASNKTKFGEWSPDFAGLTSLIVKVLQANGIPAYKIVYPAISCIGEPNEAAEWSTCFLPSLKDCGSIDIHLRMKARSATNPLTHLAEVRKGFDATADYLAAQLSWHSETKGKRIVIGELYVTPGDVAKNLGEDINAERQIALDVCKARGWPVIVWGLDVSGDVKNDRFNTFSGWLDFFFAKTQ